MSNSPLVDFTLITSNSSPRTAKISAITIHHMATDGSVESCGMGFANPARRASSNYGIDSKGRVGLYVDESRRSWCSSNGPNDNRAITIEVANCSRAPEWRVNDIAFEKTIELCVDICKRNDIPYLNYTGDENGNFTMHCWFQNTSCPGPYMISRFHEIANEVNRRLGRTDKTTNKLIEPFKLGEKVQLLPGAKYNEGNSCPSFFIGQTFYVREVMGNYIKISTSQTGAASGVVHKKYLKSLDKQNNSSNQSKEEESKPSEKEVDFNLGEKVHLKAGAKYYNGGTIPSWLFNRDLYVRKISGNKITFSIYSSGAVTGDTYSSNLIKLSYLDKEENKKPDEKPENKDENISFSIGEKVRLKDDAKYYNGNSIPSWVFNKDLYVRKISGDRITFSIYPSGAVTGDTHSSNLIKI